MEDQKKQGTDRRTGPDRKAVRQGSIMKDGRVTARTTCSSRRPDRSGLTPLGVAACRAAESSKLRAGVVGKTTPSCRSWAQVQRPEAPRVYRSREALDPSMRASSGQRRRTLSSSRIPARRGSKADMLVRRAASTLSSRLGAAWSQGRNRRRVATSFRAAGAPDEPGAAEAPGTSSGQPLVISSPDQDEDRVSSDTRKHHRWKRAHVICVVCARYSRIGESRRRRGVATKRAVKGEEQDAPPLAKRWSTPLGEGIRATETSAGARTTSSKEARGTPTRRKIGQGKDNTAESCENRRCRRVEAKIRMTVGLPVPGAWRAGASPARRHRQHEARACARGTPSVGARRESVPSRAKHGRKGRAASDDEPLKASAIALLARANMLAPNCAGQALRRSMAPMRPFERRCNARRTPCGGLSVHRDLRPRSSDRRAADAEAGHRRRA